MALTSCVCLKPNLTKEASPYLQNTSPFKIRDDTKLLIRLFQK